MAANGRLPSSLLAPIGGGYFLRNDAARAFNAMSEEAHRLYGVHIGVVAGYRSFQRQVELYHLWQIGKGNLAAVPGTSNHGWGLAIDLASPQMRRIVDKIGAKYGFSKSWSDAQSEWWHVLYQPGHYKPAPPYKSMRLGSKGDRVKQLQRRLRQLGFKSVRVTGFYGVATRSAIKRFQKKHHLKQTGVVDLATARRLRNP